MKLLMPYVVSIGIGIKEITDLNYIKRCKIYKMFALVWRTMIEKDPKSGLWRHPQPVSRDSLNNTEEMIDNFVAECERQAAKLEITVDYYIKEFI